MGRKSRRSAIASEKSKLGLATSSLSPPEESETSVETSASDLSSSAPEIQAIRNHHLTEVQEIQQTLLADFRTKRKARSRGTKWVLGCFLKGDAKKRLGEHLEALHALSQETDVHSLLGEFREGLAGALVAEFANITTKIEFQEWVSESTALMCQIGKEFQSMAFQYLTEEVDLEQEFKTSLTDKARDICCTQQNPNALRSKTEDPTIIGMSLDQLVNYITEAEAPNQENPELSDDFRGEVARFRKRLEQVQSPGQRVVPLLSEEWLDRVAERTHTIV